MSRWLILIACGCASLTVRADIPDPGTMALASSQTGLRDADESASDKPLPVEVTSPKAAPIPASLTKPNEGSKATTGPAPKVPAGAVVASAQVTPNNSQAVPGAVVPEAAKTAPSQTHAVAEDGDDVPDDGSISDTNNVLAPKPAPDAPEKMMAAFDRVDYLRKHHDGTMAASYLRDLVTNAQLLPQDRARAMLELADALEASHQEAESLCWLKIWVQMFPSRPEFGAVAFRIGTIYTHMGLADLARDAYYLALAHSVNDGQVKTAADLKEYTRLTVGTLWALSANEYEAGQWGRAAELFARYRVEATTGSELSMEKAAFLQADCYYQLKQTDKALSLYEETLGKYPFNTLAPEARLRLYHLDIIKNRPEAAKEELESLAWTVRTVWPKQETYWQEQTAQMLLALNQKNMAVLPPLFHESSKLKPEGKSWQDALNHYDALVSYQMTATQGVMDSSDNSSGKAKGRHSLREEDELLTMNKAMDQVLPPSD